MTWDELDSDDGLTRILAVDRAAREGGPELIGVLLDLALHDPFEVRTTGGVAEVHQRVSDAAGQALRGVLARRGGGVDERIRAAARDLGHDDDRVSLLLRHLGAEYEPVRRELETSDEERLRVRALRALRPFDRPPEVGVRFLADPSPAVRLEALASSARLPVADLERALADPAAEVRQAAATKLRIESDDLVNDVGAIDTRVAERRQRAGDTGVSAAIAARALIDIDEQQLLWIVGNPLLLRHVPEVRGLIVHLHRHAPLNYLRHVTGRALEADPVPGHALSPEDSLDDVRRARLLREVLRWAEAALGPEASDGLKAWTAAPDDDTAARWITEHDWFGEGAQAALLRAAVDGDLRRALAVELRPGREAALLRLAHRFTADQLRAGLDPIAPGPLNPLLLLGPDALRVQSVALRLRAPVPLSLRFRTEEPASLFVACPGCAEPVRVTGDVAWIYRDDDRVAEFEDGYRGALTGDCPACGASAGTEVRLSQTTRRFSLERELSWDAAG